MTRIMIYIVMFVSWFGVSGVYSASRVVNFKCDIQEVDLTIPEVSLTFYGWHSAI